MIYKIAKSDKIVKGTIHLTSSKSESNRALIIQALCKDSFEIKNLTKAQDTKILAEILNYELRTTNDELIYDIGHSGTTMRFLTAFFATKKGVHVLTGSKRMKERPIKILVDALRLLGAEIEYIEKENFAPLKITGKQLNGGEIEMDGTVSSQFVSALLMIAPVLQGDLIIRFKGEVVSRPYITMTIKMMESFGVSATWEGDCISVKKQIYQAKQAVYEIEGDWSSASYWYSMVALAKEADLTITGLKRNSLQGDSIVASIYSFFGVITENVENGIRLTKISSKIEQFGFDFSDSPDLAQTVAVTTAGLNIPTLLRGLQTLKSKETDRIEALKNELQKIGAEVVASNNSLQIIPSTNNHQPTTICTYDDHRMAMSFAPLALILDSIAIENPLVVNKSYPNFWDDLKSVGFEVIGDN